jgi:DNA-directed RNA polymerase sigma subunit (sigma70/sigma32)
LVIRFRFGINTEPRTLDYIGENILGGISRERVRQIQESALNKLRNQ